MDHVLAVGLGNVDRTPGSDLLELIQSRPAWHADAACKEHPEVDWFPGRGGDFATPKRICDGCLVSEECLAAGIANDVDLAHEAGIWGGVGARNRQPGGLRLRSWRVFAENG